MMLSAKIGLFAALAGMIIAALTGDISLLLLDGFLFVGVILLNRPGRVKVVRCIDCAHCREKDMFGVYHGLECSWSDLVVPSDGYCHLGERKDGE